MRHRFEGLVSPILQSAPPLFPYCSILLPHSPTTSLPIYYFFFLEEKLVHKERKEKLSKELESPIKLKREENTRSKWREGSSGWAFTDSSKRLTTTSSLSSSSSWNPIKIKTLTYREIFIWSKFRRAEKRKQTFFPIWDFFLELKP